MSLYSHGAVPAMHGKFSAGFLTVLVMHGKLPSGRHIIPIVHGIFRPGKQIFTVLVIHGKLYCPFIGRISTHIPVLVTHDFLHPIHMFHVMEFASLAYSRARAVTRCGSGST
jgi:hypothetical protein